MKSLAQVPVAVVALMFLAAGAASAADPEFKLVRGERPPKVANPERRLDEFYSKMDFAADALGKVDAQTFAQDDKYGSKAKPLRYAADRLDLLLSPYVKQTPMHPDVAWGQRWATAYRARVEALILEGKNLAEGATAAANAAEKDVGGRLDELNAYFGKDFHCYLEEPLNVERMREWIANLKSWNALGAKGIAELDQVVKDHPSYATDARVTGLRRWFEKGLAKKVAYGIDRTVRWYDTGSGSTAGAVTLMAARGDRLLNWKPFPNDQLSSSSFVDEAMDDVNHAILGNELLILFATEYENKPDPKAAETLDRLHALKKKIEVGAEKAYRAMRMPPAASSDADLVAIAKKVLASKESEAGPYRRMVITKDKQRYSEHRKNTTDAGDRIIIRSWTEEYEWFEVATAEKVDNDWRIVFYQLRRYTKALKGDSNHQWYSAVRNVWRRIPQGNIDK